jgi:hypothetical protein
MAAAVKQMSNPSPRVIRFPVFITVSLVDGVFVNLSALHDHDKFVMRVSNQIDIFQWVSIYRLGSAAARSAVRCNQLLGMTEVICLLTLNNKSRI